jgi:hypothetical protein
MCERFWTLPVAVIGASSEGKIMGTCIYCGKPAGLFSHQHKECREQYDNAATRIFEAFKEALTNLMQPPRFRELIEQIAHASSIQEPECKNLISSGFALLIDAVSSGKTLSEADENRIDALLSAFGMKLTDLPENTMDQYAKAVHDSAATRIVASFKEALTNSMEPLRFRALIVQIAHASSIQEPECKSMTSSGFAELIDAASSDKLLSEAEENRIDALLSAFGMKLTDLPENTMNQYAKAVILRQLDEGRFPSSVPRIEGFNPINLERDEKILWSFVNAGFFTPRTRTEYVGRSQGLSLRLMRGVYYRVGAFKGQPIQKQYINHEGTGSFVISDRNVYFVSSEKSVKIPIKKLIAIEPHSDGITLSRDGANTKQYIFTIDDPLFAANTISKLNQINSAVAGRDHRPRLAEAPN